MQQRVVYQCLVLLSLLLAKSPFAAEASQEQDAPSQALLEFLADFETDDGKWIDPFDLLDMFGAGTPDKSKEASEND